MPKFEPNAAGLFTMVLYTNHHKFVEREELPLPHIGQKYISHKAHVDVRFLTKVIQGISLIVYLNFGYVRRFISLFRKMELKDVINPTKVRRLGFLVPRISPSVLIPRTYQNLKVYLKG